MTDEQVSAAVADMQSSQSMSESACTNCEAKENCHNLFGKTDIDNVSIGLYPFRNDITSNLLENLRSDNEHGYGKTQRGLIEEIINPTLAFFEGLEENKQPRLRLSVEKKAPADATEIGQRFLKNWDQSYVELYYFLAVYWSHFSDLKGIVSDLEHLLGYFKLPKYSEVTSQVLGKSIASPTSKKTEPEVSPVQVDQPKKPLEKQEYDKVKYEKQNNNLIKWSTGDPYESPGEMQEYIVRFFKDSIVYQTAERATSRFSQHNENHKRRYCNRGYGKRSSKVNIYSIRTIARNTKFFWLFCFEFHGKKVGMKVVKNMAYCL